MSKKSLIAGLLSLVVVVLAAYWTSNRAEQRKRAIVEGIRSSIQEAEAGRFDAALAGFRRLTETYPDDPSVWLNLGIAYVANDHPKEAEEAFAKALSLDPKDYDAMAELATLAKRRGETEQALKMLGNIPEGQGRLGRRLREDVTWHDVLEDPRMKTILAKHTASESSEGGTGTVRRIVPKQGTP